MTAFKVTFSSVDDETNMVEVEVHAQTERAAFQLGAKRLSERNEEAAWQHLATEEVQS